MSIEQPQKRHGIANAKVGNKVMGNIGRTNIGYHTHWSVCLGLLAVLLLASSQAGSAAETPQLAVQSDSASSFVIQASGTLYV